MKQTLLNQEFPSPLKPMAREILTAGHGSIINVRTPFKNKWWKIEGIMELCCTNPETVEA